MKESFLKVAAASNGLAFMELTAPFSPCVGLWTEKFDGPACEEERMVGLHVCRDTGWGHAGETGKPQPKSKA